MAAAEAIRPFTPGAVDFEEKSSRGDPVTAADLAANEVLLSSSLGGMRDGCRRRPPTAPNASGTASLGGGSPGRHPGVRGWNPGVVYLRGFGGGRVPWPVAF